MKNAEPITTDDLQVHGQDAETAQQSQVSLHLATVIDFDCNCYNELNWLISHLSKLDHDSRGMPTSN